MARRERKTRIGRPAEFRARRRMTLLLEASEMTALHRPTPPPAPTPGPTVQAYAEGTWLPRKVPPFVRATLADTYRSDLRCHVLPAFGDTCLSDITRSGLLDFRGRLTRSPREGGT